MKIQVKQVAVPRRQVDLRYWMRSLNYSTRSHHYRYQVEFSESAVLENFH
jgi:hypothetical protein